MSDSTRSGYAAIVGRPNVGKSTLLNHMLGIKLSITSRKPQTTRHRVLGILTQQSVQLMFVDTPGVHEMRGGSSNAINRFMNQQAIGALADVDVCVHVIDARGWREEDELVLRHVAQASAAAICVLNKVDCVKPKPKLLPVMQLVAEKHPYEEIIPTSALKNDGLDVLIDQLCSRMPEGPHLYDDDEITDRPTRFLVAEMVREQVVRQLGDELPYRTTVVIESYKEEENINFIDAVVYVERESQKGIVIGKGGERLKSIGSSSRRTIEAFLERKIMLNLVVRVHRGWTNERLALTALGYQ